MDKFARKRTYLFAVVIGAALFLLTPALKADTISLVLSQTTFNVSPGQSFTINGTLTQSGADSLGSFTSIFSLGPPSFFNLDPAFFAFLTGSSSSAPTLYSGPMYDLTVFPSATISSTFAGFVEVGAIDSTGRISALGTGNVPYTVTIVSAVPEPSSFFLLSTGLLIMLGAARRRLAL